MNGQKYWSREFFLPYKKKQLEKDKLELEKKIEQGKILEEKRKEEERLKAEALKEKIRLIKKSKEDNEGFKKEIEDKLGVKEKKRGRPKKQ